MQGVISQDQAGDNNVQCVVLRRRQNVKEKGDSSQSCGRMANDLTLLAGART